MFKVFKKPCKNCLFSANAIVSSKRIEEILKECKQNDSYFICHVASLNGQEICCKRFFDKEEDQPTIVQLVKRLNLYEEIDQLDSPELRPYSEE